jgi:DNA-binding MarR family transcriptional regulator
MKSCTIDLERVSECTCKRLRQITRRVTQVFDHALEPSGLTATQFGILANLLRKNGPSIGDLAHDLGTDPTTLNRNLAPLLSEGFVRLEPSKADRRLRLVFLTELGHGRVCDAEPQWRKAQEFIEERLGRDGTRALNALLDQSHKSLSV